jgi:predicted Zn-dependent protease
MGRAMFDEMLKMIVSLPDREPVEILPPRLNALFALLADESRKKDAHVIEDEIWELWTTHPNPQAATQLNRAIEAIAAKRLDEAQVILDDLVRAEPLWPEAWNKRATLLFLSGRDAESVRDISRVLELEPRHFGALSGFAQICLRQGNDAGALLAFEAALKINPHLLTVRIAVDELRRHFRPTLH